MAEDINKKIKIEIEAETDQFKKGLTEVNKLLDDFLQKQKQFASSGDQTGKAFQDVAAKVKSAQAAIDDHRKAIELHSTASAASNTIMQQTNTTLVTVAEQHKKLATAVDTHASKTGSLNTEITTLSTTLSEQEGQVDKSKKAFDVHKATMDKLSSSFNQLKGVSGTFGPSLKEAAEGFEALKSGLDIVKTGFTSVGAAIKTTGFGVLVVVLQSVIDYFTKTTEGSATLKGAISAIGQVVEIIHKAFAGLGKIIVDAVSHPIESIKALGKMILDNIINRFKAFSVILDGIIHLDFKKIGDGIIQSVTGVTHATDKIATAFVAVKKGVTETAGEMVKAYKEGYDKAKKHVDDHEAHVKASNKRLNKSFKHQQKFNDETFKADQKAAEECKCDAEQKQNEEQSATRGAPIETSTPGLSDIKPTTFGDDASIKPVNLLKAQEDANAEAQIKKDAIKKVEEYAKQSAEKMATDALKTLGDSIKQQADAKVAALEKDKTAELTNKSLTSAQRLAIENKYKKQEADIKIKAFKDEQKLSIAQAVINGAQAVTKVTSQSGILAPLEIGVVVAETAAQIAKIASQKPPAFAQGGHFRSDGKGALLSGYSRTDNTNAYLRSGEAVVVSEAMQVPWARNLVSAINVGFGGRDFSIANPGRGYAVGGIFTGGGDANRYYNQPVNDQKNLANTIAYQMINNFPPVYADVKDINNQQNILAQTINRVNL